MRAGAVGLVGADRGGVSWCDPRNRRPRVDASGRMAQDQTKKDDSFDLVAEFRRVAATADFDQPAPELPPVTVSKRPPPLPPGMAPGMPPDRAGLDTAAASATSKVGARLPPALPLPALP